METLSAVKLNAKLSRYLALNLEVNLKSCIQIRSKLLTVFRRC